MPMRQQPAAVPPSSPPPSPASTVNSIPTGIPTGIPALPEDATPAEALAALTSYRKELRNQLDRLEGTRRELTQSLQRNKVPEAATPGVVARLRDVDAQIASVDRQLADANLAVARAAAVPGAVVSTPATPASQLERFAESPLAIVFTLFVLAPMAGAYAWRLLRRPAPVPKTVPPALEARFEQITQAIDAVAIEVERIGEGQRFITKALGEGRREAVAVPASLPASADPAQRVGP
jgi:hypothetical protein